LEGRKEKIIEDSGKNSWTEIIERFDPIVIFIL
jgi:hypothetical protein